jgi:cysteinyl-tRNA synthetase
MVTSDSLSALKTQIDATNNGFVEAMDDDFNTAGALGHLFELVRVTNQARADGATDDELAPAQTLVRTLTAVLGLTLEKAQAAGTAADGFIDLLIEVRKELRTNKMWALSDVVRDRLAELGVVLEDSKEGTSWHWN